jgi:hypothetical protein
MIRNPRRTTKCTLITALQKKRKESQNRFSPHHLLYFRGTIAMLALSTKPKIKTSTNCKYKFVGLFRFLFLWMYSIKPFYTEDGKCSVSIPNTHGGRSPTIHIKTYKNDETLQIIFSFRKKDPQTVLESFLWSQEKGKRRSYFGKLTISENQE